MTEAESPLEVVIAYLREEAIAARAAQDAAQAGLRGLDTDPNWWERLTVQQDALAEAVGRVFVASWALQIAEALDPASPEAQCEGREIVEWLHKRVTTRVMNCWDSFTIGSSDATRVALDALTFWATLRWPIAAEWARGGIDHPGDVRDWRAVGIGPDAAAEWRGCGLGPIVSSIWRANDFGPGAATEWLNAGKELSDAIEWRDAGVCTPAMAEIYERAGIEPSEVHRTSLRSAATLAALRTDA